MANFKTHVSVAAAVCTGAAFMANNAHLISYTQMPWLIFLGIIGGMLPDIDAHNSRPVRLLFNLLGLLAAAAMAQILKPHSLASYYQLVLAAAAYLLVRFGTFALFNQLTVHRGVFHSLLACGFFVFITTGISHYLLHWQVLYAWLNGVFIGMGFIVHLLLDECFSVNLSNARMKKSFGTAFKLYSYNDLTASVLMLACTVAAYWWTPSALPLLKVIKASTQSILF